MKKSILTLVGSLLLAGAFMSSSNVYAGDKLGQCTQFSTGPLENANAVDTTSQIVIIKALNNNPTKTIEASATVFALDGTKTLVDSGSAQIPPLSSTFFIVEVGGALEFEVNGTVSGAPKNDMLVSVFGKNAEGNLVSGHRVLPSELVTSKCDKEKNPDFDDSEFDF